ncbi:MAG TPA: N-6 DNA methylase, partial [Chitinophagaceae bacterium]|nr:N-6 DNA methylase [Chitinophagaceae bacterium]
MNKYSEEFGSLTKINKEFKTKLYESFLKQEVEALGQYFTPRKVIQSVIRMAGLDEPSFQYTGKRIADPFCGVGGFIVEILNMNEKLRACYTPSSNGEIDLPFVLNGFDKGFERDDERTIILAKSNMLIYLAEILFSYPQSASKFANI